MLKRDDKAQEKAPKVLQEDSKTSSAPKGTRSYSTTARRAQEALVSQPDTAIELQGAFISQTDTAVESQDSTLDLPALPLPSQLNLKHRYDPVIQQVTNLLMKDGKLSVAQRVRSSVPLTFQSMPID